MKKILAILMAVLMLASVALCGGAVAFADDTVEIHYAYWASMDDYYEQWIWPVWRATTAARRPTASPRRW